MLVWEIQYLQFHSLQEGRISLYFGVDFYNEHYILCDKKNMNRSELKRMKIDKIILLVGLIGSGKTSVGKRLAKKLALPFVDGDLEIEKAAGLSVIDVFKCFGVEEYRAGEERIMKRLLSGAPCVLASGGGAFVAEQTRAIAKEKALTIWLKADIDVLYNRTTGRKRRPFLQCGDSEIKSKLQSYIDKEYPYYSQANIVVETKNEAVDNTVNRVLKAIKEYQKKDTNHEKL